MTPEPSITRAHVREQLAAMRPTSDAQASHRNAMQALLDSPGNPFSRCHFEPGHFTASALVLAPQGDAMVVIHHRKLDLWLQPGGHIEAVDTSLLAAARREVHEETGLTRVTPLAECPVDLDVHTIPARPGEPAHQHFDVRYAFRAAARGLAPSAEVKAARWVGLAELAQNAADASVRRVAQTLAAW